MDFRPQLHPEYALAVVLAALVALAFPITRDLPDARTRQKYWALQALVVIAAVIGAKLADKLDAFFGFKTPIQLPVHQDQIDAIAQRLLQARGLVDHHDRRPAHGAGNGRTQVTRIGPAMANQGNFLRHADGLHRC